MANARAPKKFEPDDPMELKGVMVPGGDLQEMVECLVEEYVKIGFSDQRLLSLFRNPFFAGLHAVYQQRGDELVREVIARVRQRWGAWRIKVRGE